MREDDLKAVLHILRHIKGSILLESGFERILNMFNYSDLDTLISEFEKVSDAVSKTDCAMVRCGIIKELEFYTWDIEVEQTKLAVAGNHRQFVSYCAENDLNPSNIRYVSSFEHICGFRDCEMLLIGDYWTSSDFLSISEYCDSHNIRRIYKGE